jgi:protoporphyrin/coproporphyrin ferrochelatase
MTEEKTLDNTSYRKGVLLMNYGGPRSEEEVFPFLEELFNDPFIFNYPGWLRKRLAKFMARRRSGKLISIYKAMERFSPIWEETEAQAKALQRLLGDDCEVFTGMRYFPDDMKKTIEAISQSNIGELLIFPLYPQDSETTTSSAIDTARRLLEDAGFRGHIHEARSFFREDGFIEAIFDLVQKELAEAENKPRIIFAAHGLPVRLAFKDRYHEQVIETAKLVSSKMSMPLALTSPRADSWQEAILAFQSKVGPMKWLSPSVEEVIQEWSMGGCRSVLVVPISFVSEHSETLYELDVYYKNMAEENGMNFYRVPTVRCHPLFIDALSKIVKRILNG